MLYTLLAALLYFAPASVSAQECSSPLLCVLNKITLDANLLYDQVVASIKDLTAAATDAKKGLIISDGDQLVGDPISIASAKYNLAATMDKIATSGQIDKDDLVTSKLKLINLQKEIEDAEQNLEDLLGSSFATSDANLLQKLSDAFLIKKEDLDEIGIVLENLVKLSDSSSSGILLTDLPIYHIKNNAALAHHEYDVLKNLAVKLALFMEDMITA